MKEKHTGRTIGRIVLVFFTTLLLLVLAVAGVVWVVMRGPSIAAQELLTRSLKETSAIGFIADLYLPKERVAEIMTVEEETPESGQTDASLVKISAAAREKNPEGEGGETAPAAADQGKDIELVEVVGTSYNGIMMIVKDPKRLFVGIPDSFGNVGLTLDGMVKKYDALAGINAGGFYDPNGGGSGGTPDGIVIHDGKLVWGGTGTVSSVIGFDGDGVLHVGTMSGQEALNRNIRWAVTFGPALVVNGEPMTGSNITNSGVNPRTAIGQRADGAVLLLVVDGRQITSLGATLEDLIGIFLEFGAVNASNLDGGSSSQMIYEGESLNKNVSVKGARPLPSSILVRR